uniref:Uncharacterized protein n=1 Tax=Strigamia maritima TaxID=126957 RepID=T1J4J9_STRMM
MQSPLNGVFNFRNWTLMTWRATDLQLYLNFIGIKEEFSVQNLKDANLILLFNKKKCGLPFGFQPKEGATFNKSIMLMNTRGSECDSVFSAIHIPIPKQPVVDKAQRSSSCFYKSYEYNVKDTSKRQFDKRQNFKLISVRKRAGHPRLPTGGLNGVDLYVSQWFLTRFKSESTYAKLPVYHLERPKESRNFFMSSDESNHCRRNSGIDIMYDDIPDVLDLDRFKDKLTTVGKY